MIPWSWCPAEKIEIGIEPADISRFENFFNIHSERLFHDEVPEHWVRVDTFSIDKYPVTNAQFKRFTDANPEWQPGRIPPELDNGNYLKHWKSAAVFQSMSTHPVVNVNWYAAVAYCRWAGKRLPSEAEWEYAARAGDAVLFPWGNQPVDKTRANYSGSGLHTTVPVGIYPPNRLGLFDMAGNVWQFLVNEMETVP